MTKRTWTYVAAACLAVSGTALIISGAASMGETETVAPTPSPAVSRPPTPRLRPTPTPTPAPTPSPSPPLAPALTPTPSPLPNPPVPALIPGAPWTGPARMPVLMYHFVNSDQPADDLDARLTVTDAEFARQLAFLRCAGYFSITLTQLFDAIYAGAPLPERPVVLSFDDGYLDAYTHAFPLLRATGFGGTFAIVTGWVGLPGEYVSWDQLREMAGTGMEIAAHSISHPDLGKASDDIVRDQLSGSKRQIEETLGLPVSFFFYPSSEPFRSGTPERQAQVAAIVQQAGYRGAVTARFNLLQDPAAPFALNRVRVSGGIDIQKFAENMGAPAPETIGC